MIEDQRRMSWCLWSEGGGTSDRLEEEVVYCEQNREFCEDGEVVRWRAIGHREGRCNGRIGRGDHKL